MRIQFLCCLLVLYPLSVLAEVLESHFQLEARPRTLIIRYQEPGAQDEILLDGTSYTLTSRDDTGVPGVYLYNAERRTTDASGLEIEETLSISQEAITLGMFRSNPRMTAKNFGFRNADEVTCSKNDNALLMLIRADGAKAVTLGNCLRI